MEIFFKRILVGFDNSLSAQLALERALDFADRFDSKVYAIYVNKNRVGLGEVEESVKRIAKRRNHEVDFIEKQGKVYKEINIIEKELGVDLIVVGTHGLEGWQPFWIGSNAYRVVSASNCPVITIQESAGQGVIQDIVVPLDDSVGTRQKIPYCCTVARAFGATVHLYGVSGGKSEDTNTRIQTYVRQAEEYMTQRGVKCTGKVDLGVNLPKSVLKYAEEKNANLIIMMTETESTGVIMGSYAQYIINNSVVPVMSVHSRDLYVVGAVGY